MKHKKLCGPQVSSSIVAVVDRADKSLRYHLDLLRRALQVNRNVKASIEENNPMKSCDP